MRLIDIAEGEVYLSFNHLELPLIAGMGRLAENAGCGGDDIRKSDNNLALSMYGSLFSAFCEAAAMAARATTGDKVKSLEEERVIHLAATGRGFQLDGKRMVQEAKEDYPEVYEKLEGWYERKQAEKAAQQQEQGA
jgi:hypothetical protein